MTVTDLHVSPKYTHACEKHLFVYNSVHYYRKKQTILTHINIKNTSSYC